ncbi:hypothetical protein O2K51_01295 [Apibacter raozihei]|uniref:hypothetical protein n=1 Tax=Apibacter TaxID=1778601 RepID=UPI000FE35F2E|nr:MULTISPECIES: hypothetical protein [Apibacter]
MDISKIDNEISVFKKAIVEFAETIKNEIQLNKFIEESRSYIQFLITYYLRLGRLESVNEQINSLDLALLDEVERINKRIK